MPQYLEVFSKEGRQWYPARINDWENLEEAKQKLIDGGYKVRIPDQSVYLESHSPDAQHLT
jgi:hypothetical protein